MMNIGSNLTIQPIEACPSLVGVSERHLLVELLANVELHGVHLDGVDEETEVDLPLLGLIVVGDAQVGLRLLQRSLDREREIYLE